MARSTRGVAATSAILLAACALVGAPALAISASDITANSDQGSDPHSVPAEYFEEQFEEFEALPPQPVPDGNVVDLAGIEPPIEIEREPGGRVSRSLGTGVASYYGRRFHGRRTANGERFNMNAMTAAHKTLPFGTKVRVTNPRNGKSVTVRINDRGPFIRGRTIDLSRAAATRIGMISSGHARVKLDIVK